MASSKISPAKMAHGSHSRSGMVVTGNAGANIAFVMFVLLGLRVPLELAHREEGLTLGPLPFGPNTAARPCRIFTGFLASQRHCQNTEEGVMLSTRRPR